MANLVCGSNGNFSAGVWRSTTPTHNNLGRGTSGTNTTTSFVYSPLAVLGTGDTVDAITLLIEKLLPTGAGTFSVALNDGAVDARTVTVNLSALPVRRTFLTFVLDTPFTGTGQTCRIGVRSSVAATVGVYGTASNEWTRQLRTPSIALPLPNDNFIVAGEMTNASVLTTRTVTYDGSDTTVWGDGTANSGLGLGLGGTFTFRGTDPTYFKVFGSIYVGSGATFAIGTAATPHPRGVSATVEFACATDGQFGFRNYGLVSLRGESRSAGKNVVVTKLIESIGNGQLSVAVEHDTGWRAGDEVVVQTYANPHEKRFLGGSATASALAFTLPLTYPHLGIPPVFQQRVVLLTRDIVIRGTSYTPLLRGYGFNPGGEYDVAWAQFKFMGATTSSANAALGGYISNAINSAGSKVTARFSTFEDAYYGIYVDRASTTEDCVFVNCTAPIALTGGYSATLPAAHTSARLTAFGGTMYVYGDEFMTATIDGWYTTARMDLGQYYGVPLGPFNGLEAGCASGQPPISVSVNGGTHSNWRVWGCTYRGLVLSDCHNAQIKNIECYGNGQTTAGNLVFDGDCINLWLDGVTLDGVSGLTSFGLWPTVTGVDFLAQARINMVRIRNLRCGLSGGYMIPHTVTDLKRAPGDTNLPYAHIMEVILDNPLFTAPTPFAPADWLNSVSVVGIPDPPTLQIGGHILANALRLTSINGTSDHRSYVMARGIIQSDSDVYRTGAPSERVTVTHATSALRSSIRRKPVSGGRGTTISVWVYQDAGYSGPAPKLLLLANLALGIPADVVLATFDGSPYEWTQLTAVTPSAQQTGVFDFTVEIAGLNSILWIDDWDRP